MKVDEGDTAKCFQSSCANIDLDAGSAAAHIPISYLEKVKQLLK